jgi:hypothetical protein
VKSPDFELGERLARQLESIPDPPALIDDQAPSAEFLEGWYVGKKTSGNRVDPDLGRVVRPCLGLP